MGGGKRGCQLRLGPPQSGRHLLAAEKPLTKFAVSPRGRGPDGAAGPQPGRRVSGRPQRLRRPSAAATRQEKPRLLPAASLHTGALTQVRTLTHAHTQQKEAVRAACGGLVRALRPAPPPAATARPRALTYCSAPEGPWVRGSRQLAAHRPGSARPRSRAVPAAARRLWAQHPRGSVPLLRPPPPSRAPAKSRPCGCRIRPGLQKPREQEGSLFTEFFKK